MIFKYQLKIWSMRLTLMIKHPIFNHLWEKHHQSTDKASEEAYPFVVSKKKKPPDRSSRLVRWLWWWLAEFAKAEIQNSPFKQKSHFYLIPVQSAFASLLKIRFKKLEEYKIINYGNMQNLNTDTESVSKSIKSICGWS